MKKLILLLVFIFLLGCSGIVYEQNKETEVYFSPSANLNEKLIEFIDSANSTLYCAFYDMNEEIALSLAEKGKKIDVRLIMDDENKAISGSAVRVDGDGLMHNKFCIADSGRVWTGSFNPTDRGSLNNNNVMIIHSEYIAHDYEDEFFEMWQGEFKSGKKVRQNKVILNNSTYEIYFCPEDNCGEHLLQKLNGAEKSIYFMLFSFTRKDVSDVLIEKHLHGIDVKGIVEKSRIGQEYNQYKNLAGKVDVITDNSEYTMHNKVFIIDNKTVVTGSFNPTESADTRNDENMLIIHDTEIAAKFIEEFNALFNQ